MKTKPDHWYRQSAAAPVRFVDGQMEILLVTSLGRGRWILPKGIIEPDMTPAESAEKEAWEEAGVKGAIDFRSLGAYEVEKWGGVCRVEVFRMEVGDIAGQWPEAGSRRRKWFRLAQALREIHPPAAAEVLRSIRPPGLVLTLVRHAKSSRDDPGLADFMRPLNDRGRRDAPVMGHRLRRSGVEPDLIVSSPAARAIQTARIIAGRIDFPEAGIVEDGRIYEASAQELLALVRRLPDDRRDVMLVGHNQGLSDLVSLLLRPVIDNIPTCGVVRLLCDAQHWHDIKPGRATLLLFDYPKKDAAAA